MAQSEVLLFNRWSFEEIEIPDLSLADYIASKSTDAVFLPHTAGRWQKKRFAKARCPIVERLVVCMMFHGRNGGAKATGVRIVKHCLEIIHLMTDMNPIQVLVSALAAAAPPLLGVTPRD